LFFVPRSSRPPAYRLLLTLVATLIPRLDEPAHFLQRLRTVVHLQPHHDIVVQPHAFAFTNDQDCCGLHATLVASAGLTAVERRHQPHRQVPRRCFERLHHVVDNGFAREDVSLRGAVLALSIARPVGGTRTGIGRDVPRGVDHRELPAAFRPSFRLRIRIVIPDRVDDFSDWLPGAQQLERLRTVAHVHDRLRCHHANARFAPEHTVADREHARLHCAADLTCRGVISKDRKGCHRLRKTRCLSVHRRDGQSRECHDKHAFHQKSSQTVFAAVSATTGIASARNVNPPNVTSCTPECSADSSSASVQPPSGPMKNIAAGGGRRS
jgi:hypothetical protein